MSRLPGESFKRIIVFFRSYGPLKIWAFQTCQQDICLKLGQLIRDDEQITWLTFKKVIFIFPELWPF